MDLPVWGGRWMGPTNACCTNMCFYPCSKNRDVFPVKNAIHLHLLFLPRYPRRLAPPKPLPKAQPKIQLEIQPLHLPGNQQPLQLEIQLEIQQPLQLKIQPEDPPHLRLHHLPGAQPHLPQNLQPETQHTSGSGGM